MSAVAATATAATTTTTTTTATTTTMIAETLRRLRAATARRGDLGRVTSRSVSTLGEGLRCETREGATVIHSDLPPALGGEATAPTPTELARAALGACLAMCYRMRASELGVHLTSVRVTVESESDVRGLLDVDADAPPGWSALRYHVELESAAPAREVRRIVDLGDRVSPVLDMLTRPLTVERTVSIGTGG